MEGSLREVSGVLKESKGVDFQGSKVGEFKGIKVVKLLRKF